MSEKLQDAASLATAYLPLIIMAVHSAGDATRSEESRQHDTAEALKMLDKIQVALSDAGV